MGGPEHLAGFPFVSDPETAGAVVEALTYRPLPTLREIRIEVSDAEAGRHWSGPAGCWCDARHLADDEGLTLILPPWDESRSIETAPVAVAW